MDFPVEVQRSVASFTSEGSRPVRRGSNLFGSARRIAENCVCGLCVSAEARASHCTLFGPGGARVVQRTTSEVCLPVCLSRRPISMLLRLAAQLLPVFLELVPAQKRIFVRVALQTGSRPDWTRPYILDVFYDAFDGELHVSLLTPLAGRDVPDILVPGYRVGSRIPETAFRPGMREELERELLSGDGKACSLVVVAPEAEAGGTSPWVHSLSSARRPCLRSARASTCLHRRRTGSRACPYPGLLLPRSLHVLQPKRATN